MDVVSEVGKVDRAGSPRSAIRSRARQSAVSTVTSVTLPMAPAGGRRTVRRTRARRPSEPRIKPWNPLAPRLGCTSMTPRAVPAPRVAPSGASFFFTTMMARLLAIGQGVFRLLDHVGEVRLPVPVRRFGLAQGRDGGREAACRPAIIARPWFSSPCGRSSLAFLVFRLTSFISPSVATKDAVRSRASQHHPCHCTSAEGRRSGGSAV